jgi:acyl phosphate:glycerol-3-phosphate acyltransferase
VSWALAIVIGYGLGSIPMSVIVAGRHGVDLRRTDDGNPGAWNALGQLGGRRAWPAFAGDGLKALLAGLIGRALGDWWVAWTAVAAAMVGHAFPIWSRGRGGKSVMCFAGGVVALSPPAALLCWSLCAALGRWRSFALGTRVAVVAFPFAQAATDPIRHVAGTGALMTLIGALFLLRRRPGHATGAEVAPPRSPTARRPADRRAARASTGLPGGRSFPPSPRS